MYQILYMKLWYKLIYCLFDKTVLQFTSRSSSNPSLTKNWSLSGSKHHEDIQLEYIHSGHVLNDLLYPIWSVFSFERVICYRGFLLVCQYASQILPRWGGLLEVANSSNLDQNIWIFHEKGGSLNMNRLLKGINKIKMNVFLKPTNRTMEIHNLHYICHYVIDLSIISKSMVFFSSFTSFKSVSPDKKCQTQSVKWWPQKMGATTTLVSMLGTFFLTDFATWSTFGKPIYWSIGTDSICLHSLKQSTILMIGWQ